MKQKTLLAAAIILALYFLLAAGYCTYLYFTPEILKNSEKADLAMGFVGAGYVGFVTIIVLIVYYRNKTKKPQDKIEK